MERQEAVAVQLLDGQGVLNSEGLESFAKTMRLADCGLSYAVVAIMGPQSSGKSTLMNNLFHTKFAEMDALQGRSQTTQGVWLARAVGLNPCTIVMDLEGTDGRERGEDDTAFEKQSALFALAVADIVLVNMWCHDIGREHAANKPLLKTVFQVMTRLFTPRRTTLLFVIRDKTRTPMEVLEPILRSDIQKIWDSAPKPASYQGTELTEFFNVQVTALSNYEEKREQFDNEVTHLRKKFSNSIVPGGLAGDRRAVVPGTGFPLSVEQIWKVIKSNKDLDLPAHKVMVATVRCEEIASEKLKELISDQEWHALDEMARAGSVTNFGERLSNLLDKHISGYDLEATYFDESVRTAKRNFLVTEALETVHHSHQAVLNHSRANALSRFKREIDEWPINDEEEGFAKAVRRCTENALEDFDTACKDAHVKQATWDTVKPREKLQRDLDAYASSVQAEKLAALVSVFEKHLDKVIAAPTVSLLDGASTDTWPALRSLLSREIKAAQSDMSSALSGFELDDQEAASMLDGLVEYGKEIVNKEARKEAGQALLRMKDRFNIVFSHDEESLPRVWSGVEDIRAITKDARAVAIKGLGVLAATRLEEDSSDCIEDTLVTLLNDTSQMSQSKSQANQSDSESSVVLKSSAFASSTWDGVPPSDTLITPVQCKSIWRQFKSETDYTIGQALAAQEASKHRSSWLPPPWAIAAMIVLGFNEFMALLRNPLYILLGFVVYLLAKAVYVQLDVGSEFRHGFLAGTISLASKILPTFMNVLNKLAQEGQKMSTNEGASSNSHQEYKMQNFAEGSLATEGTHVEQSGMRYRQPGKAA